MKAHYNHNAVDLLAGGAASSTVIAGYYFCAPFASKANKLITAFEAVNAVPYAGMALPAAATLLTIIASNMAFRGASNVSAHLGRRIAYNGQTLDNIFS